MDERVSSWRMIFAVACVLLVFACIPPDRLVDPFGLSPRAYDAVEPAAEAEPALAPETPSSPEMRQEEEIALRPSVQLACQEPARPREVGTVPFERQGQSPNVFRLVSVTRTHEERPAAEPASQTQQEPESVAAGESMDLTPPEEPAEEPNSGSGEPILREAKLVVLGPPPRGIHRRSYDELLQQFSAESPDTGEEGTDRVIALPSPPPDEIRHPSWIEPRALLAALDGPKESPWASNASRLIGQLGNTGSERFSDSLAALRQTHERARDAVAEASPEERGSVRLAAAALGRHVEFWSALAEAGWPAQGGETPSSPDRRELAAAAGRVDAWLRNVPNRAEWVAFLGLAEVYGLAAGTQAEDDAIRKSARLALGRVIDTHWTKEEEAVLASEPFDAYVTALREWSTERVDFGRILKAVERFETTRDPADARRLAAAIRTLRMSPSASARAVGEVLDRNYRNANCLARVRTEFLNRFVPQREAEYEWVRDVILGQPVQGNAKTESTVYFRTVPADDRIRLALEVEGSVSSLTSADAGPAVLFNNSHSTYVARKQIALDADGVKYEPSTAQVYVETRLRGLRTALDPIPLFGSIMQDMVLSQHQQKKPYVRRELQRKVAAKARQRVDQEANPRLDKLSSKYHDEVLVRLGKLGIVPEMLDAETTKAGFIAAVRLAAADQLAAYGPPPVLDSDAEAAIWLHETALNNLLARMPFNGKTVSVAELAKVLSGDTDTATDGSIAEKHGDVRVTFAPTRAVRVACKNGEIELTLAIRELEKPPKKWRNFFVTARLKPTLEGKQIQLARTGVVGLYGRRFRIPSQIALRGIFSKVFDDDRPFEIVPASISQDERLAELRIAAFAARDGWIVFALDGKPIRVADETGAGSSLRR